MSLRSILVLLLAGVCGVSTAVGARYYTSSTEAAPEATLILVASVEIARGTPIKPEFVEQQQWPTALLPPGAVVDIQELEGHIAVTDFVPGEPVIAARIAVGTSGAASLVEPGMRAFTIAVSSNASGVGGFVLPGNHVDVLLTLTKEVDDALGGAGTWTLLQDLEVLAADTRLNDDGRAVEQLRSVTLLVTPDVATKLTLAAKMGELTLTLRNHADHDFAETVPVTVRELYFLQEELLANVVNNAEVPEDEIPRVEGDEHEDPDGQGGGGADNLTDVDSPKPSERATVQIRTYHGTAASLVSIIW